MNVRKILLGGCSGCLLLTGGMALLSVWMWNGYSLAPPATGGGDWQVPPDSETPSAAGELSFELLHTLDGHEGYVSGLAFSPDASRLASSSLDGTVKIFDPASGGLVHDFRADGRGRATAVAIDPGGRFIATADGAAKGRIFDLATGELLHEFQSGAWELTAAAYSADGSLLFTASSDPAEIEVRGVADDYRLIESYRGQLEIEELALAPDGKAVATAACFSRLKRRRLPGGKVMSSAFLWPCGEYFAAAFSSDLREAAHAADGPTIFRWNVEHGGHLKRLRNPRGGSNLDGVTALAYLPGDEVLAAGTVDGRIEFWHLASKSLVAELFNVLPNDVSRLAFSADGRLMATGDWYGALRLFRIAIGEKA